MANSSKAFGLQTSISQIQTDTAQAITSGTYDQTKTNLVNRVQQAIRTGAVLQTVGASPVKFISTQDLNTFTPVSHGYAVDPQPGSTVARVFIPITPAAAILTLHYFDYDTYADTVTYVGQLKFNLNTATVHTIRGLAVDDNSGATTGWSFHFVTTNATVANGGYFYAPNCTRAQFNFSGSNTIASATTGDTQASNKVFWMQETGGINNLTVGLGLAIDTASKIVYSATATTSPVFYKWTYSTAITVVTAAGVTSDCFNFKTGANAFFATALFQTNTMKLAVPKSGAQSGNKCIYLSAASTGYYFPVTDISNGSTTVPNVISWNKLGTGVDYSAVTYSIATWSNVLDVEFNYSTTGAFMMKRAINNDPNMMIFGKNDIIYAEVAGTKVPDGFAGITIAGMFMCNGVLMATSTVVGQRGVYAVNVAADKYFLNTYPGVVPPSYFITPVMTVNMANAICLGFIREYMGAAPVSLGIQYRTSNFGVFPGTWTTITPNNGNLVIEGGMANVSQIQLRIPQSLISDYGANAAQINEIILSYVGKLDSSDNWRLSVDYTSRTGDSPVKVTARQVAAYSGGPVTIYFYLYDSALNLVATLNTSTHFAQFKKSSNGGASFSAMTGANDYTNSGSGNTLIELDPSAVPTGITPVAVRES